MFFEYCFKKKTFLLLAMKFQQFQDIRRTIYIAPFTSQSVKISHNIIMRLYVILYFNVSRLIRTLNSGALEFSPDFRLMPDVLHVLNLARLCSLP